MLENMNAQVNKVEVAAQLTKKASLMNKTAAAVNLGDQTLVLLKMMVELCNQLKDESQQAQKELEELKQLIGGNNETTS